jgi:ubiquitin carboxyl-terminal hydrolase 7
MTVNVLLEDAFDGHQGNDLYDPEKANYRAFRVRKHATVQELLQMLAENFKYPINQIRPWPFSARSNHVRLIVLKMDFVFNCVGFFL